MKLTIVYDNELHKKNIGLKSDWGFSCLIETAYDNILFDTGAKGKILLNNMDKLGINPSNINKIVISHEHWDHDGGLKALIPFIDDVELYRLGNKNTGVKIKLTTVEEAKMIAKYTYTTGRLNGMPIDEQSLVLKGEKGWCVLVGCSHPGVENILHAAKQHGDIVSLIGGFHSFNNFLILEELNFICPCHCTKYKREIKELYPSRYNKGGVGKIIKI